MAYDLATAKAQLANLVQGAYTEQDLLDLVRQVDITAEGDQTVLYRGKSDSGHPYSKVADQMVDNPNIRVINKTARVGWGECNEPQRTDVVFSFGACQEDDTLIRKITLHVGLRFAYPNLCGLIQNLFQNPVDFHIA